MQQQRRADEGPEEEEPRSLAAAVGPGHDYAPGWQYPREYLAMNPDLAGRSLDEVARHYFQFGAHEGRSSKRTWKKHVDRLYACIRDRTDDVCYAVMCDAADEHAVALARRLKSALLESRPNWRCVSGVDENARPHLVVHLVEAHRLQTLPHDMETVNVAWTWCDESLGPVGIESLVGAQVCADLVVAMCPATRDLVGTAHAVQPAVCGAFPDAASSKELRDMPAHTGPAFWAADAFTHTMLCEGDVPDADKDPAGHRAIVSHLRKSRRARACMFESQRMLYGARDWSAVGADLVALLERRLGVGRWHVDLALLDDDPRSLEYALALKDRLVGARGASAHVLLPGEDGAAPPADRTLYIGDGDAAPDGALHLSPRDLPVPLVDFSRFAPRRGVRRANTVTFARGANPDAFPRDTVLCMPPDTDADKRGELLAGAKFAVCDDGQSACEALAAGCGVLCTQPEAEAKAWLDALPRKARTKNVRFGATGTEGLVPPTNNTMGQLKLVCDFMDLIDRDLAQP